MNRDRADAGWDALSKGIVYANIAAGVGMDITGVITHNLALMVWGLLLLIVCAAVIYQWRRP